jgi:taurine--2-oxoglutarate transaminase
MIDQIELLPAAGPHAVLPVRTRLAAELARRTGLSRTFLATGGSEAVENALKIARLATGRHKVITRAHSYHGATLSVLALAGDPRREPFAAGMPAPLHIDDPWPPRPAGPGRPSDWLESFELLLAREGPETIAAVLLEGWTGTNGMQEPPADFWPGVRARCDEHGILLIDDEIFAGFGRTGRWFAREHWGVRVDMMTLGKGMTSGCAPLSAVMLDEDLARRFDDEVLWCGLTHYAHPVACAAALASMAVLDDEGLVENADRRGVELRAGLDALRADPRIGPHVRSTRGRGLMQALELDRPVGPLLEALLERGIYAPGRGPLLFLCPPLCLSASELAEILAGLDAGLRDVLPGG